MDLQQNLDEVTGLIKVTKNFVVQNMEGDDPGDIAPHVAFERDGQIIGIALSPAIDRDIGLRIAQIGVVGFAADAVYWACDAHVAKQAINPLTGERWKPGEMQNACDAEGLCLNGVLQDALMVVCYRRDEGLTHIRCLPYNVDKAFRSVEWLDEVNLDGGADGLVVDGLTEAFSAPPARVAMIARQALPLGLPGEQQGLIDRITIETLRALGVALLLDENSFSSEAGLVSAK
jgi:hypothetical protein